MPLTLMTEVTRRGIASLVQASRAGLHTLPAALLTDYTSLETLATAYESDPQQDTADQAAVLSTKLVKATAGGAADALITGDIKTAIDGFLTDLQDSDPTATPVRWQSIRTSWRILRGRALQATNDPAGLDSLHAEVSNLVELGPAWQPHSPHARYAAPWGEDTFEARLKWILTAGGDVWAPTASQQNTAWAANRNASAAVPQWAF
ncbi:hypothetical protein HFP71_16895 [Streptomyces sp. ARC32]